MFTNTCEEGRKDSVIAIRSFPLRSARIVARQMRPILRGTVLKAVDSTEHVFHALATSLWARGLAPLPVFIPRRSCTSAMSCGAPCDPSSGDYH